jgi:predicted nucleic acid-binding protein
MTIAADAFLDSNVLVYAVDSNSPFYRGSREVLEAAHRQYFISPQIAFEFLSLVTNPKRVQSPLMPEQANEVLKTILTRHNIRILPLDAQIMKDALKLSLKHNLTGPQVFDALIAAAVFRHRIPVIITANRKHFEDLGLAVEPIPSGIR